MFFPALCEGIPAIGVPGAGNFKPSWLDYLRDREVLLALDMDEAGEKGAIEITRVFREGGLPPPPRMRWKDGKDLAEHLQHRTGLAR